MALGVNPVSKLAGHVRSPIRVICHIILLSTKDMLRFLFHDTFGTEVANSMAALYAGIRTVGSSIGGLG